jgi:hypothetical protein
VSMEAITWSALPLKSDLIFFRLMAPDGSGTYFQITDTDSFITCIQMATRAPSYINYAWLVHMNMKNNLSLRKHAVPRTKSQPGHHYIRQPADASSWVRGCRFYILFRIQIRKKPAVDITHKDLN